MPETQFIQLSGSAYRYVRDSFFEAGQVSSDGPPSEGQENFQRLWNVMPPVSGTLQRRWGYGLWANGATTWRDAYEYQSDALGTRRIVLTAPGTASVYTEAGALIRANAVSVTGTPRFLNSRDYGYFLSDDEDMFKWDGSDAGNISKWGIDAPVTAASVGSPTAGAITLQDGRKYYLIFKNDSTGHYSGLSPVSASTGPITGKNIPLSNLEISSDPQVTKKTLLATADGGDETLLFELAELDNAATSYTDSTPEEDLLAGNVFLETDEFGLEHGVVGNDPPPTGTLVITHRGRLVMANGEYLNFSKNLDELLTSTGVVCGRYEEAWPPEFQLDVSEGAEAITGLFSDGDVLYVGTERCVRKILGDGPENFSKPEIAFNEAGVLTQEAWHVVFLEGAPVGAMWLTPDYRVIASDFNTYHDVGKPIQDVLDTINRAQASKIRACAHTEGRYSLYILAVPTGISTECNTLCVFSVATKRWFVWTLADNVTCFLSNIQASGAPQLLFGSAAGPVYKFSSSYTQDRVGSSPVAITSMIRTAWLHLGQPAARKLLNELELMTGDPAIQISVEGASNEAEFAIPLSIKANAVPVTSPFGEYKLYLASAPTKDRYYRVTFTSSSAIPTILNYLSMEVIPTHSL